MSDILIYGLKLSIIGMLIVFLALVFIASVISIMRKADRRWEMREKGEAETALASPPAIDDLTMVLISAAAATMMTGRQRIRSVRRILPGEAKGSAWSQQGRATLHGSHVYTKR